MADAVKFSRGQSSSLPSSTVNGQFYLCEDTGELYIGYNGSKIKITDPDAIIDNEVIEGGVVTQ